MGDASGDAAGLNETWPLGLIDRVTFGLIAIVELALAESVLVGDRLQLGIELGL